MENFRDWVVARGETFPIADPGAFQSLVASFDLLGGLDYLGRLGWTEPTGDGATATDQRIALLELHFNSSIRCVFRTLAWGGGAGGAVPCVAD